MRNLLLIVALSVLSLTGCTNKTFLVESPSMEPIIPRGSKVRVDLSAYREALPDRFDIVVFTPPTNKEHVFVFRVLALPGEHIELQESQVLIDGKPLQSSKKITYSALASGHPAAFNKITLANDELYLVGDNVAGANDSRFLGPIKRDALIGKVVEIRPQP
ncbi:signal peptidase I [Aquabacterium sp.]|uniref:signal peptidase I n=1 Tax=Aquabacterium sp. TaxID=1872578 RepID=UPI00345B93A4